MVLLLCFALAVVVAKNIWLSRLLGTWQVWLPFRSGAIIGLVLEDMLWGLPGAEVFLAFEGPLNVALVCLAVSVLTASAAPAATGSMASALSLFISSVPVKTAVLALSGVCTGLMCAYRLSAYLKLWSCSAKERAL